MQKLLQRLALALLCANGASYAKTPCTDTYNLSVSIRPPGTELWLVPTHNGVEATLPFNWTITGGDSKILVKVRRLDADTVEMELGLDTDGKQTWLKARSTIPADSERTMVHLAQDTATGNLWGVTFEPTCPKRWI